MSLKFQNSIPDEQHSVRPQISNPFLTSSSLPFGHTKPVQSRAAALYDVDTKRPLHIIGEEKVRKESISSYSSSNSFPPEIPQSAPDKNPINFPLWWTAFVAVIPVLAFTVTLVTVIFLKRVTQDSGDPFDTVQQSRKFSQDLLVNVSATRLVFVASWSSTLAPMLLGSLMTLWHIPTAYRLVTLSQQADPSSLPTPQQLSLLVGLAAGSLDELRKYVLYRFRRFKAAESPLLTRSASIMTVSSLLAGLVFGADTLIHALTTTLPVDIVTRTAGTSQNYGRGMISRCVNFDRRENQGLPCTVVADASVGANTLAFDSGAILALESNASKVDSIWQLKDAAFPNGDLVVLMPQTKDLTPNLDYTTSTIGVSTQCKPATRSCDVRLSDATSSETYVLFNCTDNFRGVLGASVDVAVDTTSWTRTDDTTPDFNVKLHRNFQYGYFSDPDLKNPYNSIGGVTGQSDSSGDSALAEDSLLHQFHLGVAGFVPVQSGTAGSSLLRDTNALAVGDSLIAYTLGCTVTAYDVQYTWTNNNIQSFTYTPTTNGTVLEFAHGMQAMGMPSLAQGQSTASLSSDMDSLAVTFGNTHSFDAISLIGSVMSARTNIQEATRSRLLVTKVPLATFAYLLLSNVLFIIFSAVLALRAMLYSSDDTRDMVAKLSVEGLAAAAFEDRSGKQDPGPMVVDANEMFEESRIGRASRRVALRKATGGSYAFRIEQPLL